MANYSARSHDPVASGVPGADPWPGSGMAPIVGDVPGQAGTAIKAISPSLANQPLDLHRP
jgi:hypothetical protein